MQRCTAGATGSATRWWRSSRRWRMGSRCCRWRRRWRSIIGWVRILRFFHAERYMWRALSAEKDEVTRAVAENDKKVGALAEKHVESDGIRDHRAPGGQVEASDQQPADHGEQPHAVRAQHPHLHARLAADRRLHLHLPLRFQGQPPIRRRRQTLRRLRVLRGEGLRALLQHGLVHRRVSRRSTPGATPTWRCPAAAPSWRTTACSTATTCVWSR